MNDPKKIETHPSFGMISVSHVTGNAVLYGSEFRHQHFIELKITRGKRERDLSRDWYFGGEELISVFMSEAQFVEMVGRPNFGSGVPCTLRHVMREAMPEPPEPRPITERFRSDVKENAKECARDLREVQAELEAAIESGKIGKTVLRELSQKLKGAASSIDAGIPFVEKSFEESMEAVVNHAATEIEATVAATAMRLGIERMREISAEGPKMITQALPEPEGEVK